MAIVLFRAIRGARLRSARRALIVNRARCRIPGVYMDWTGSRSDRLDNDALCACWLLLDFPCCDFTRN